MSMISIGTATDFDCKDKVDTSPVTLKLYIGIQIEIINSVLKITCFSDNGKNNYSFNEDSKGIRFIMLRPKVISSVYSNSLPTEIPRAIVDVMMLYS